MKREVPLSRVLEDVGADRVAILASQSHIPLGRRACANCGHNPSGAACQLNPPESAYSFVSKDGGPPQLITQTFLKKVPAEHVCGQHRFVAELKKGGAA